MVCRYAADAARRARRPRNPGNPAGAALRGSAGARLESTPVKRRTRVVGAVLAIIGLPLVLVLIDAVSSYALHPIIHTLDAAGEKRQYILHVPKSYDRARPAPLV